jgi:hypothetical protein
MAYEVSMVALDEKSQAQAVDLLQKLEALDGALADIQTARAAAETVWRDKENAINIEKSNVKDALRALRGAQLTEK